MKVTIPYGAGGDDDDDDGCGDGCLDGGDDSDATSGIPTLYTREQDVSLFLLAWLAGCLPAFLHASKHVRTQLAQHNTGQHNTT